MGSSLTIKVASAGLVNWNFYKILSDAGPQLHLHPPLCGPCSAFWDHTEHTPSPNISLLLYLLSTYSGDLWTWGGRPRVITVVVMVKTPGHREPRRGLWPS